MDVLKQMYLLSAWYYLTVFVAVLCPVWLLKVWGLILSLPIAFGATYVFLKNGTMVFEEE